MHPEPEAKKRRSTRIVQAVPLTVTGVDALGRPFQERTSTLIINCHGCRYQSKHYVLKNMWVTFEVPHPEAGREPRSVRARVTWIQRPRTVRELFQIGTELEVPGNVWGIAFPPSDWIPFPESASAPPREIPSPSQLAETAPAPVEPPGLEPPRLEPPRLESQRLESPRLESPRLETVRAAEPEPPAEETRVEDNVRVLPSPATAEASMALARQVARLVADAKEQIQNAARDNASRMVAAETKSLLSVIQGQLKEAADRSVEAAVASSMERMQRDAEAKLDHAKQETIETLRADWNREIERRVAESRDQLTSKLDEAGRAKLAALDDLVQSKVQAASDSVQKLGGLDVNAPEFRAQFDQLRRSFEESVATESKRWQEQMDQGMTGARSRLANLEKAAKSLTDQIASATATAQAGWRGTLEADLAAARQGWNEKFEALIGDAERNAADQLKRNTEATARNIEEQVAKRVGSIGNAFSQAAAEAEAMLGTIHASLGQESAQAQAALSQLQQTAATLEAQRMELASLARTASEELARRGEAMLESQSAEMTRRAEQAVGGMVARLQPVLESAGQESVARLGEELEQRLAPQIAKAGEMLGKLAFDSAQAEKALADHEQRMWNASEKNIQDAVARAKEVLASVEKDFGESSRAATSKWLADLETRATETTHTTFESLYKSADWYEKKFQTQMQTAMEKGLESATANLREKAREMSGLFGTELDHYSRSYVDHAQNQMEETAREAAEKASVQMAQAGDAAATNFTDRAQRLADDHFSRFATQAGTLFDQNAARMEAHTAQVRSKLESDARRLANDFQTGLTDQAQKISTLNKQELDSALAFAKNSLQVEAQTIEKQMHGTLQALGNQAMDEYKGRLENASNSWLVTTVTKLDQQSADLISRLATTAETRLRDSCNSVFAEVGETLRQRLLGLSSPLPSASASPAAKPEEKK